MNDLDRIENALATKLLSPPVFERCAQDLLTELYAGLTPIPGGTDWGRDADIAGTGDPVPPRLLVTSSRTLEGVRKNMLGGIKSMKGHSVSAKRLVLANPANLRLTERQKLVEAARKAGMRLDPSDIFDRGFFGSRLRRDGYWRNTLLGLPSGSITLSRIGSDLAESPWAFLPLLARDEDVAALEGDDDLILTGPPGVGKSRLAGEVADAAFVDKDADFGQVASDLRWALPAVVIVDDAGDQAPLVRRLLSLRQTEPDLFKFRLLGVCWPDDVEDLRTVLPAARVHTLDLIERAPMDELLQLMGITGQLARSEILDQAEGRPGWAVALADLLLRSDGAASLLQGKALLGQVDRYLRRAGINPAAVDVLSLIAALGGVSELELRQLAKEADVPRSAVAAILGTASRSGLIDVQHRYSGKDDRSLRYYIVRPPMLADVLVAERVFDVPAPMVDFDGLAERWPDRLGHLAGAAVNAALLGADAAGSRAEHLLDEALGSESVGQPVKINLSTQFLRLGKAASTHIMQIARQSFDEALATGTADGRAVEPIVKLASLAARWYQTDAAVEVLLDACLVDSRPTNSNTGHPLRQIEDLVSDFHPEVPRQHELRYKIAAVLKRWLDAAPDDIDHRRVAATVMSTLMGLRLRSAHSDPGRPMTIQLIETVVSPEEMRRIFSVLWPLVAEMLNRDHPELADAIIEVAGNWLRIGGDYDQPFGQSHHSDCVAAAKEIGEALVAELAARTDLGLGTRIHLQSTAEWHDVAVTVDVPTELEVFFRPIERREADWREAEQALIADLKSTGEAWASEDPTNIISRLVEARRDLEKAKLLWPDRPWIVCMALAEHVADPMAWLAAAEAGGFMPDGCRFAERALNEGQLTEVKACSVLAVPSTRQPMLGVLLTTPSAPPWARTRAIDALTAHDFRLIETAAIRDELTVELLRALLTTPAPSVRGMVALALFVGEHHRNEDWTPAELESVWLEAVLGLRTADMPETPDYEFTQLFQYLAQRYPSTLAQLVECTLAEAADADVYRALPHDCWDVLYQLPAAQKLTLWHRFSDKPWAGYLLQEHLVGSDVDWLKEMLDGGEITPEESLDSFRGSGPEPPMDALAKLLVPRGVDPDRIAGLRFSGSWMGEESHRYEGIVASFKELASDDDPHVQLVAQAGIRIFSTAQKDAEAKERQERIRGHR